MKTYYLVERGSRVLLIDNIKDSDTVLETITSESWLQARLKVKEINYAHNFGYGWIVR